VFDNFEHILDAAPLASEILAAAPHCKVLTTSREPLRLYGENIFRIDPLPLPDLRQPLAYQELHDYTAIQLFLARAQAIDPGFVLSPENIQQIAELCVQLDGLPLALELAASQIYAFTPAELAAQLKNRLSFLTEGPRDRSARQQTMRGAIDWSYNLLNKKEQRAFNRLGIFSGRFTAEAAAEIVGPVHLQGLTQKSLLQQESGYDGRPRYWMLQVLREYAIEPLKADQTLEQLKQKHTAYYLKVAETAEPHLTGPEQNAWFALLEEDHDNFRAILDRSLDEDAHETTLLLGSILWRLWAVYSYLSEGTLWLEAILDKTSDFKNEQRAKVLFGAGRLALFQQKLSLAGRLFRESLDQSQALQERPLQAALLNSLGEIALQQAAYDQAGSLFHESLNLFQTQEDKAGIGQTLTHLGQLAFQQEQHEQANQYLLESLELVEEVGTPEAIAIVLNGLGEIARMQSRLGDAAAFYERSLALYRQLNYGMGQAAMLHNLGQVKLTQEKFQEAATLFRQSLSLLSTMEEKVYIGWNLAGLGAALLNLGNSKQAVRLFSATKALFEQFGGQLDISDQAVYDHYLAQSKQELTESEWQQAWLEGRAMPVENELLDIITLTPMLPLVEQTQF
jgi:predicted ATPase/Tfp pilus assembly protein PilF